MKFLGDYHIHTFASDGKSTVADYVAVAKQRGFEQIAITDHSFASFIYHMTEKKFDRQEKEICELGECGVKILHGIEANLIGDKLDVPHSVLRRCDVLTVGFHRFISPTKMNGQSKFLFANGFGPSKSKEKLIMSNTEAYIGVMENYPVDVLAHLCHRAKVDMSKICECAVEHGVYIELNEKHLDALENDIKCAIMSGVKFIVGTDSHKAKHTGKFEKVEQFIKKHKIPIERVFGMNSNEPTFKNKKEWRYGSDV